MFGMDRERRREVIPTFIPRLLPLLGIVMLSGCEEPKRTTIVYPPAAPATPPDLTPIGEAIKVFSVSMIVVAVIVAVVVLVRSKIQP